MSKIAIDRAVVEQALGALHPTSCGNWTPTIALNAEAAIHALRAALEQMQIEQQPVAWIEHEWSGSGLRHLHFERPAPTVRDEVVRPVWTPLYLHPQPPRQPLTDQQIHDCFQHRHRDKATERRMITRAIEEAIWKKNS